MLDLPVLFPFGHGLSYTSFSFSRLEVEKSEDGDKVSVSIEVQNTGEREGKEVVQVYVSQKSPSIRRPKQELKGFKKVSLGKGEKKTVVVEMETKNACAFWDEIRSAWIVERDEYEVLVGASSQDERMLKGRFEVDTTWWWNGL